MRFAVLTFWGGETIFTVTTDKYHQLQVGGFMSDEQFSKLIAAVNDQLRALTSPVAPDVLIERVQQSHPQFSAADIRRGIWHLESQSQLDFENDWRIKRSEAVA